MDIWETDKLLLFIKFVIPGFISLKTYELLFPRASKTSAEQLIDAIAYSSINYALLLWPIYEVETHNVEQNYPTLYVLFYVFVLLGAPVLWAYLWRVLRKTELLQGLLPHPSCKPWDEFFCKRQAYWVIVDVKDGRKFGGRYDSQSFASSAPAAEQLYLEEAWLLNEDGGLERPRVDSAGIMILAAEIVAVEFFHMTSGDGNDEQTSTDGRPSEGLQASSGETQ